VNELATLAVHLPNWVGDVVMALPALAHLRDRGSSLHCFGKRWARELIEPFPDRFSVVSGNPLKDAGRIRRAGAGRGVVFANSLAAALAMRAAGIKAVGYDRRGRGALLGHAIPWRRRPTHEIDAFAQLARACGEGDPRPQTLEPRLPLTGSQRSMGKAALSQNDVVSPYVVLAPFSTSRVRGKSKCWSEFPRLAQHVRSLGFPVVVCPGPGEEEAGRRLGQDVRVLPDLGLGGYAAVLAESRLVVANDSGPMHLAAAVGAPVLGLFGVTDPARTAPRGRSALTLGAPARWPSVETVLEVVTRRLSENILHSKGEPCVP
jgi:heptosyltransferase-2